MKLSCSSLPAGELKKRIITLITVIHDAAKTTCRVLGNANAAAPKAQEVPAAGKHGGYLVAVMMVMIVVVVVIISNNNKY